jgi:AcrR family transcriptional regulator
MKSMTDKSKIIFSAAARVFTRYGYSKTTMGDIAAEAGVARQTLYNAYQGKEEILRAVVRQGGEATFAAVMAIWEEVDTVAAKLTAFQEHGPVSWFETIAAAPDRAELVEGLHKVASDEMSAMDLKWRAAFAQMLLAETSNENSAALKHDEIVDFFFSASLNAKYGADDIAHLRRRLATIKTATLALLDT